MHQSKTRKRTVTRYSLFAAILALLALGFLAACGSPTPVATPAPVEVVLTISGSGTTTPILSAVKQAFEADVPGYSLNVLPGTGSGGGVEGIVQGKLDAAAMARPPKDTEVAQGVEYVEFGQSGMAVYTHPDVGVTELTKAQVTAIFSGEITNWSQAGGADQAIILYVRDEDDSSMQALRQAIFGDAQVLETAQVLTSQADMQVAVAGTSGSVGLGSWSTVLATGTDVQAITLDGIQPNDPSYSIVEPIGISYLLERQADVQPLIDWLISEPGQIALQEYGVISTR